MDVVGTLRIKNNSLINIYAFFDHRSREKTVPDVLPFQTRRPRQDRHVAMRLDGALVDRVDGLAARLRTTRSAIVRRLLIDLLAQDAKKRCMGRSAA